MVRAAGLLMIVVIGAGVLYWAFFIRVYNLDVCQMAMRTIEADKSLRRPSASRSNR